MHECEYIVYTTDQSETNSLMGPFKAAIFSDVKAHPDWWAAVTTVPLQGSHCSPRAPTTQLGLDHSQYCDRVDSSNSLDEQLVKGKV